MNPLIYWIALLGLVLTGARSDGSCKKLEHLDYEYFGTKTIYKDARHFLAHTDEKKLPKSFDDDSLANEHRDLQKDYCSPQVLYFIGRHSARFPDGEDIEKYNHELHHLIKKLESSTKCSDELHEILEWKSKMEPKQNNLITELGAKEEREIAKRLKHIYPEFFDAHKSHIEIGVTSKIRTAQSGAQFLQEIEGLNLPSCEAGKLPTNDVDDDAYSVERIHESKCYKDLMHDHRSSLLDFYVQCEKINGETKIRDPLVERVKAEHVVKPIADKVAKKLGLDNHDEHHPAVGPATLESIYNMCKFENALQDKSVWCKLFDKEDIQALEYIEDVKTYIKGAYGPKANAKQSCPLIKSIVETFHEKVGSHGEGEKKAFFYFSHAEVMKKLIAAFGMFKDEHSFTESKIEEFEHHLQQPRQRNWRSSFLVPFSSNMVLTLYKCEKPNKPVKFKILTALNEQAVKVQGCDDEDCKVSEFFGAYDSMRQCDLHEICSRGGH